MADPTKKYTARDQSVIDDYIKTGGTDADGARVFKYSMTQLAAKYEVTTQRIFQILDYYKVPRRSADEKRPAQKAKT